MVGAPSPRRMKPPVAVCGERRCDLLVVIALLGFTGPPALLLGACGCTSSCSASNGPRPARQARVTGGSRLQVSRTPTGDVLARSNTRANDAGRPSAAGPPPSDVPSIIAVARRWLTALGRWEVTPRTAPAGDLQALSTPALRRRLLLTGATREPSARSFGPQPLAGRTVALSAYLRPGGWTVIATWRFGRDALAVELMLTRTGAGPRVSSYEP